MRHAVALLATLAVLSLAAGCASLLDGDRQMITVEARSGGVTVPGVRCMLKNDQGEAWLTTPGTTSVRFDRSDLKVVCSGTGLQGSDVSAGSKLKPKVFGNLLIGGLIGFGIDHFGGAAYQYPSAILVEMSPRPPATLTPPPSAADERARLSAVRERAAASLDEMRSLDLVRSTACEPSGPLAVQLQEAGMRHYAVGCRDGRIARTVCQQSACRFKALDD
jgi:hypothetical protein